MTTNRKRYVKKEIGTVSNFIDHIKFHLICGIVGKIWVREIGNIETTAKKEQKSVMHVQSFCFANIYLLRLHRSRCRRRRCC